MNHDHSRDSYHSNMSSREHGSVGRSSVEGVKHHGVVSPFKLPHATIEVQNRKARVQHDVVCTSYHV